MYQPWTIPDYYVVFCWLYATKKVEKDTRPEALHIIHITLVECFSLLLLCDTPPVTGKV
jgi:hypothetical protein